MANSSSSSSSNKRKSKDKRGGISSSTRSGSGRSDRTLSSNVSAVTRQVSNVSDEGRREQAARSRSRSRSSSGREDNILVVNATNLSSPIPLRERSRSQPVDMDEMVDNMVDVISPANTFDTVPMNYSRSFNSNYSDPESPQNRQNLGGNGSYLPVSLQSPSNNNNGRSNNGNNNGNDHGNNNTGKVVIEHKSRSIGKGGGGGSAGGLFCLLKSILPFIIIMALAGSAGSIYGWLFKFPTLNKQVKALEEQVLRLNSEIDRLSDENDRYENLNDRLNGTVWELEGVADNLNLTVYELEDVAFQLNITKDELIQEINTLQSRNQEYQLLNQGLSTNVEQLANEVQYFQNSLQSLTDEHTVLKNTTTSLQELANQFANTTINQNETLAVLKQTLEGFAYENDRLEKFNTDLMDGLTYLNTTLQNGIDTSIEEITLVLGQQVQQQQLMTLKQLEISYIQMIENWDCNYRDVFNNEIYGQNYDAAITDNNILPLAVSDYVNERVLSKLCLDIYDFSNYLNTQQYTDGIITSNQLIRSTILYTNEAMKYYFPITITDSIGGEGSGGDGDGNDEAVISSSSSSSSRSSSSNVAINNDEMMSDWINAGYRCELLKTPFIYGIML